MMINGKWEENISCRVCGHRHPASLSCKEARMYAEYDRAVREAREQIDHGNKRLQNRSRDTMIAYLLQKVEECDWHAVSDAANDLRVMEAKHG